jgi:hypothetical protein
VHVRRALLLFAIVLGLAAIAASVSRQPEESGQRDDQPAARSGTDDVPEPEVSPGSATPSQTAVELLFEAELDQTRRVDAGQPATVLVETDEPGLVEIPDLGQSASAEPLTPARFELLVSDAGRYGIEFKPAADDTSSAAGTLVVRAAVDG